MKNSDNTYKIKLGLILLLSVVFISIAVFIPAIKQDLGYHQFIDSRSFFGIANFFNVASNGVFLIIGLIGVVAIISNKSISILQELRLVYLVFFIGVFFVALGSSYYHLIPTNQSLVWDRLPMTIAFMAIFSLIIAEFISIKVAKVIFIPLLLIGLFSIWYWDYTEQNNVGDLRLYALVQFLPMILIPIILLMFRGKFTHSRYYWFFLLLYCLAKMTEMYDALIYEYLVYISGHSIKHILASFACIIYYLQLKNRDISDI